MFFSPGANAWLLGSRKASMSWRGDSSSAFQIKLQIRMTPPKLCLAVAVVNRRLLPTRLTETQWWESLWQALFDRRGRLPSDVAFADGRAASWTVVQSSVMNLGGVIEGFRLEPLACVESRLNTKKYWMASRCWFLRELPPSLGANVLISINRLR